MVCVNHKAISKSSVSVIYFSAIHDYVVIACCISSVKGMWTSTPKGWPEEVPFCDPNNGQKVHGKPRKEVLMKMFQYLVGLYSVRVLYEKAFIFLRRLLSISTI